MIILKESLSLRRRAAASGKLLCFEEGCCPSEINNENVFFKNISGLRNHLQRTHKKDFKCTTDQDLRVKAVKFFKSVHAQIVLQFLQQEAILISVSQV